MNAKHIESFLDRGFNRRQIGRIAGVLAGASLPLEFAMAQQAEQQLRARMGGGRGQTNFDDPSIIRISQNENAQGPCKEGVEAMARVAPHGWRYNPNNEQSEIVKVVCDQEGVKPENVQFYAGSSDPLQRIGCAYTGPNHAWCMAGPGYGNGTPEYIGAKTVKVPLAADYSHDVETMIRKEPNAGVYYVCNPNNPSGTLTSRDKIQYLLDNKKNKDGIVLVDEAYIHFSANAKTCSDMVAAGKDVIVMRTFSKIYGMAGLRVGYVMGRPELVSRLRQYGPGFLPVTGVACALASLKSKTLVPERRAQMKQIREDLYSFLDKKKIKYVPSEVNFFMMETNHPGAEIAAKYAERRIIIGRVWQEWPTHVRISIGTQEEMNKFKQATSEIFS
jgi:histidinol-phosphate aminotransferase